MKCQCSTWYVSNTRHISYRKCPCYVGFNQDIGKVVCCVRNGERKDHALVRVMLLCGDCANNETNATLNSSGANIFGFPKPPLVMIDMTIKQTNKRGKHGMLIIMLFSCRLNKFFWLFTKLTKNLLICWHIYKSCRLYEHLHAYKLLEWCCFESGNNNLFKEELWLMNEWKNNSNQICFFLYSKDRNSPDNWKGKKVIKRQKATKAIGTPQRETSS